MKTIIVVFGLVVGVILLVLTWSCVIEQGYECKGPNDPNSSRHTVTCSDYVQLQNILQKQIDKLKRVIYELRIHMEVDHGYQSGELIDGKNSKLLKDRIELNHKVIMEMLEAVGSKDEVIKPTK